MISKATERITTNSWSNLTSLRADATTVSFHEAFDVAIATLVLSIMPDIKRTVQNIHEAL